MQYISVNQVAQFLKSINPQFKFLYSFFYGHIFQSCQTSSYFRSSDHSRRIFRPSNFSYCFTPKLWKAYQISKQSIKKRIAPPTICESLVKITPSNPTSHNLKLPSLLVQWTICLWLVWLWWYGSKAHFPALGISPEGAPYNWGQNVGIS